MNNGGITFSLCINKLVLGGSTPGCYRFTDSTELYVPPDCYVFQ